MYLQSTMCVLNLVFIAEGEGQQRTAEYASIGLQGMHRGI